MKECYPTRTMRGFEELRHADPNEVFPDASEPEISVRSNKGVIKETIRGRWLLFFLCAALGLGLLGCTKEPSGDKDVDRVLQSFEQLDKSKGGVKATLLAIGQPPGAANECIEVTYSSGGTTKYCGSDAGNILANCSKRGWKCKKVGERKLIQTLRLLGKPEFEDNDLEIAFLFKERGFVKFRIRSGTDSASDFECDFNPIPGIQLEQFCNDEALAQGCTGCSTEPNPGGGSSGSGTVTCTDCKNPQG